MGKKRLTSGYPAMTATVVNIAVPAGYFPLTLRVAFTHARETRVVDMNLVWLKIRLPHAKQVLWLLVAHDPDCDRDLALIADVPIQTTEDAETVYTQ